MARLFAFFTLFHLSLTFFRPEVPFKGGRKLIGFEDYSEEQYELLMRKGIYPYKYMSSWDKFTESQLPPKKAFYSNLNMSNVSNGDYQQAKKVWNAFNIKSLGEYHDLYLKTDARSSSFLYISLFSLESLSKENRNYVRTPNRS